MPLVETEPEAKPGVKPGVGPGETELLAKPKHGMGAKKATNIVNIFD